jgi:nicotinamidase-related amidase
MKRIPPLVQSKTCFFLCDIQEKFRIVHSYQQVITTAQKLSKASKILEIPLIVTEHYPKALGKTVSEIDISHAILVEEKTKFSMWIPPVEQKLEQLEIESVVLFGIESHVCILQTALDLLRNEKQVFIIADGISSINQPEVKIAMNRLRQSGCTITTSESILFELMQNAKHKDFKAISGLIKETKGDTKLALVELVSNL